MGQIVTRKRKAGGQAYLARIRLKANGRIAHQETRTFETHRAARDWIRDREAELAKAPPLPDVTLSDAIQRYVTESRRQIGKTKAQVLEAIKRHRIAFLSCRDIRSQDIVQFAQDLLEGLSASTVGNYLSHLQAVFAVAGPAWGMPLEHATILAAGKVCKRLGLTSKSGERSRRPTVDEVLRLIDHFDRRASRSIPMSRIIRFAILSTRRQEEITRIRWEDLDRDRVLVRDMKHPGEKEGNNCWCELPAEAMAVIEEMPRVADQIFPFSAETISISFTMACKILGIEDLHFHDLRHEGISRLLELGRTIPQVASVSGHRSWNSLKRYTHLRQTGDKLTGVLTK